MARNSKHLEEHIVRKNVLKKHIKLKEISDQYYKDHREKIIDKVKERNNKY